MDLPPLDFTYNILNLQLLWSKWHPAARLERVRDRSGGEWDVTVFGAVS